MSSSGDAKLKVQKSEAEWCAQPTPAQYRVTREHGAERAFTGPAWNEKRLYARVCCGVSGRGNVEALKR